MVISQTKCAGVSEWQTMQTQNLLWVTTCGFKSHRRHEKHKKLGRKPTQFFSSQLIVTCNTFNSKIHASP